MKVKLYGTVVDGKRRWFADRPAMRAHAKESEATASKSIHQVAISLVGKPAEVVCAAMALGGGGPSPAETVLESLTKNEATWEGTRTVQVRRPVPAPAAA